MFGIEQHGAQRFFAIERAHLRTEQLVDQFRAIHLLRGDGFRARAGAEPGRPPRVAPPWRGRRLSSSKVPARCNAQAGERNRDRAKAGARVRWRSCLDADAQENRDQFRIAQRARAKPGEFLARAPHLGQFVNGERAHRRIVPSARIRRLRVAKGAIIPSSCGPIPTSALRYLFPGTISRCSSASRNISASRPPRN